MSKDDPELFKPFAEQVQKTNHISVIFDAELKYVMLSPAALQELGLPESEVVGRNMLDLFPDLIASSNHRNILKALSGQTIQTTIESRRQKLVRVSYKPLMVDRTIIGVHVEAFPK